MNNKRQILSAIIAVLISVGLVATVVYATTTVGNDVSVGGTLGVTGATTLSGLLNANAGIAVDTNAFTVADTTGVITLANSATITNNKAGEIRIRGLATAAGGGAKGLSVENVATSLGTGDNNTVMGAQIGVTGDVNAEAGSTLKGIEAKARAVAWQEGGSPSGGTFDEITAIYGSADAKKATLVTNLRGAEFSLDAEAGATITEAVGLLISNNMSAIPTNTYGIRFGGPAAFDIDIYKSTDAHLNIRTNPAYANRNVHINSQTYTSDASIIGLQVKPRGGVNLTNRIAGIEVSPGINDGYTGTSVSGIISNPLLKGTTGDLTGEVRAFEGKVESDSGSTRTVTGPISILKANQAMHGTVTNGVFVIDVDAAGGNVAWSGFANLPDDSQIAKVGSTMTVSPENTQEDGYIRIEIGGTTYQIPIYAE